MYGRTKVSLRPYPVTAKVHTIFRINSQRPSPSLLFTGHRGSPTAIAGARWPSRFSVTDAGVSKIEVLYDTDFPTYNSFFLVHAFS